MTQTRLGGLCRFNSSTGWRRCKIDCEIHFFVCVTDSDGFSNSDHRAKVLVSTDSTCKNAVLTTEKPFHGASLTTPPPFLKI